MATLTTIFLILAALSYAVLAVLVVAMLFDEVEFKTVLISLIVFLAFSVLGVCSAIIDKYRQEKPKIKKYPLNEWRMNYKITTINDKSDTTLVLIKIK